jgi:hypothetical protein
MLEIVKIIEGGIDLRDNTQLPRCIIVSNSHREVAIPISNAGLQALIGLYSDRGPVSMSAHYEEPESKTAVPTSTTPRNGEVVQMAGSGDVSSTDVSSEPPVQEVPGLDEGGEDFEPGDAYSDPGTGAKSL